MTAPIDATYAVLLASLGAALFGAGFISVVGDLEDEPEGAWEPEDPTGDDDDPDAGVKTAAALFPLEANPVRQLMGGGVRRWVVELPCRLELAVVGPVAEGSDSHKTLIRAALDAVAVLPADDPTLTQTCERLEIGGGVYEDLPPSGLKMMIDFTIRLRAGDPLGRTAP